MKQLQEKKIDQVTSKLLDMALRMVGIQIDLDTLGKILDLVELLEDKGELASIMDIVKLQVEWEKSLKV